MMMIAGSMKLLDSQLKPENPRWSMTWLNGPYAGSKRNPHISAETTMGTANGTK
jgi:hypothetical protein